MRIDTTKIEIGIIIHIENLEVEIMTEIEIRIGNKCTDIRLGDIK